MKQKERKHNKTKAWNTFFFGGFFFFFERGKTRHTEGTQNDHTERPPKGNTERQPKGHTKERKEMRTQRKWTIVRNGGTRGG
jgi:hypothetical protein